MEIFEVDFNKYAETIKNPYHVFGSAEFNDLNKTKCDQVYYLLFKEGKYRLGIIGGNKEGSFYSPLSAPFGGFMYISSDIRIQYIEEAIHLLKSWAKEKKFSSIFITPPPSFYDINFTAKQVNCIWREGFEVSEVDLNYSFDLEHFDETYLDKIWYNAKKNLRISLLSGLHFDLCTNTEEKCTAYEIIRKNRESHGYPLRMSWEQVAETFCIIHADFFLVYIDKNFPFASAIVFHVSESVVQVIYWGDIPGYSEMRPMNFLSYKVFEFFRDSGKKIVDVGPSTEHSLPNYGLCEFKEGIGCRIDSKITFVSRLEKTLS